MSVDKEWTNEEYQFALDMWKSGMTSEKIGLALGRTRNAIIGKMHRMQAPPSLVPNKFMVKPKKKVAVPKPKILKPKPIPPEGITLMDLEYGMCKWPMKHGWYCGQAAQMYKPYCIMHWKIATRKAA